jgi:hypothetical protein
VIRATEASRAAVALPPHGSRPLYASPGGLSRPPEFAAAERSRDPSASNLIPPCTAATSSAAGVPRGRGALDEREERLTTAQVTGRSRPSWWA